MRLLNVYTNFKKQSKVYWDYDSKEYVVRLYISINCSWKHYEEADYYTDEQEDAINTALRMIGLSH